MLQCIQSNQIYVNKIQLLSAQILHSEKYPGCHYSSTALRENFMYMHQVLEKSFLITLGKQLNIIIRQANYPLCNYSICICYYALNKLGAQLRVPNTINITARHLQYHCPDYSSHMNGTFGGSPSGPLFHLLIVIFEVLNMMSHLPSLLFLWNPY